MDGWTSRPDRVRSVWSPRTTRALRSAAMKHRMYIDEVGNPDLNASFDENHRYLSLTGVLLSLEHERDAVFPAIETLKRRYFDSHPDEPVILHRKELVNKRPPFEALRDPVVEAAFNTELIRLVTDLDYVVVTVVIDKLAHLSKYRRWARDPYHYCLAILIERYVLWLRSRRAVGDVMAESRGRREDMRLKAEFARIFDYGTERMPFEEIQHHLTSRQLKVKAKSANVAGLQLADLLAHPSYKAMLVAKGGAGGLGAFGARVAAILEGSKYRRSYTGRIDGYGRKWLP